VHPDPPDPDGPLGCQCFVNDADRLAVPIARTTEAKEHSIETRQKLVIIDTFPRDAMTNKN
jgi:hypothetical protein